MINTILFDLGNTLYQNKEFDRQYPRQLKLLLAKDRGISEIEASNLLKDAAEDLKKESSKHVTKVATMEALGYTRKQVHDAFCKNNPFDFLDKDLKLAGILNKLGTNYKLGIVSNFRSAHALEILKALGVVLLIEDEIGCSIRLGIAGFTLTLH